MGDGLIPAILGSILGIIGTWLVTKHQVASAKETAAQQVAAANETSRREIEAAQETTKQQIEFSRQQAAIDRTHRLNIEFDVELADVRDEAFNHALKYPDILLKDIRHGGSDSQAIWKVIRFYRTLWRLLNRGHLDTALTKDFFGAVFISWYEHYLENQNVGCLITSRSLKDLYNWFEANTDATEFEEWKVRGEGIWFRLTTS